MSRVAREYWHGGDAQVDGVGMSFGYLAVPDAREMDSGWGCLFVLRGSSRFAGGHRGVGWFGRGEWWEFGKC